MNFSLSMSGFLIRCFLQSVLETVKATRSSVEQGLLGDVPRVAEVDFAGAGITELVFLDSSDGRSP